METSGLQLIVFAPLAVAAWSLRTPCEVGTTFTPVSQDWCFKLDEVFLR